MHHGHRPTTYHVDAQASACDERTETSPVMFTGSRVAASLAVGFPVVLPGAPDRIVRFGRYDLVVASEEIAPAGGNRDVGVRLVDRGNRESVGLTSAQLDALIANPDVEICGRGTGLGSAMAALIASTPPHPVS